MQQEALVSISVYLLCIAITWWALQSLHFEKWIRAGRVLQARVLYILLCIAIGGSVSRFLLDYLKLGIAN